MNKEMTPEDQRIYARFACLIRCEATDRLGRLPRRFSCIMKDSSRTGCRLVGERIDSIDRFFQLEVEGRIRNCEVMWRTRKMIGVRYVTGDAEGR